MSEIIKIAFLGPESTGKTTLCRFVAEHYHTTWVPEYAREYVVNLKRKYTLDDVLHCAKEQLRSEDELIKNAQRFLFCDTELINFKVWCEDVFKEVPQWITQRITEHHYDLYLLTYHDLPFEEDVVRENPFRREFFFEWYKKELESYRFRYEIIKGKGEERRTAVLAAIEKHFPGVIPFI